MPAENPVDRQNERKSVAHLRSQMDLHKTLKLDLEIILLILCTNIDQAVSLIGLFLIIALGPGPAEAAPFCPCQGSTSIQSKEAPSDTDNLEFARERFVSLLEGAKKTFVNNVSSRRFGYAPMAENASVAPIPEEEIPALTNGRATVVSTFGEG